MKPVLRDHRVRLCIGTLLAVAWGTRPEHSRAQARLHVSAVVTRVAGTPQSAQFDWGGGAGAFLEWTPTARFGLGLAVDARAYAPRDSMVGPGVAPASWASAFSALATVRFRPAGTWGRGADGLWLQAQGGATLTGERLRPTIAGAAGLSLPVGTLGLGPFVAYQRIFDVGPSATPGDAHLFTAGAEITFGFERRRPSAPPEIVAAAPPPRPAPVTARRCPSHLHVASVDLDGDGCPEGDRDVDGLADPVDRCPDEPEDLDGFEDGDGCRDTDNDRDRIADVFDTCPNVAEVVNGVDDEDGCPDEAVVRVDGGRISLPADAIRFAFNSAHIMPQSEATLAAVARVLRAHGEYPTVYIEGHADDLGSDHYNYNLSFHRAVAVVDLLRRFGVDRERMSAMGFGRSSPVDRSASPDARARNRRVEFVLDGHRSAGRARTSRGWVEIDRQGAVR